MIYAIFDQQDRFFGLAHWREEGGLGFRLTSEGKKTLTPEITLWKKRGIPVRAEMVQEEAGVREFVVGSSFVPLTKPESEQAFARWAMEHGYLASALPDTTYTRLKQLVDLPLQPSEIRLLVDLLRRTPETELGAWDEALKRVGGVL